MNENEEQEINSIKAEVLIPQSSSKSKQQRNLLFHNHKKNSSSDQHHTPTPKNLHHFSSSNNEIQIETASLASINVNVPDPILPPTKSITVQTDEVDLSLQDLSASSNAKSDPLKISTEPLNVEAVIAHNNAAEVSLSTSFDSMEDSKSKSTDVSMEDALQTASKDDDEDEDDLPTPPDTPPIEERLKSPVSTTSRSPPSPNQSMTPTRKVRLYIFV